MFMAFVELFRRMPDNYVQKLLTYAGRDESNHPFSQLQGYMETHVNNRTIQRCDQNLWDALVKLYSLHE